MKQAYAQSQNTSFCDTLAQRKPVTIGNDGAAEGFLANKKRIAPIAPTFDSQKCPMCFLISSRKSTARRSGFRLGRRKEVGWHARCGQVRFRFLWSGLQWRSTRQPAPLALSPSMRSTGILSAACGGKTCRQDQPWRQNRARRKLPKKPKLPQRNLARRYTLRRRPKTWELHERLSIRWIGPIS